MQQARDRRHRYQPAVKPKLQTEHIGLEEPMATVVNLLDFDREPNLKVVPIFGVAGVGKTTLATRLYHLYGGSFQRRAFLRVSRKPDIRRLLTTMLSQIKGPKSCTDVQGLINDIRKCLDDKSYFIVFDDLWDTSVWDIIRNAFPARKCYSRIITTTEIEKVALACCSNCTKDMYTMDPLNPYEAQKLLLSRSFGSEDQCGSNDQCAGKEEKDVSDSIIRNSDGLPLAIVPIATMLASWSKIEMGQKKKYIQESLRLHPTSEWMKDILNLVYSDLPDHLKTCLLYFNMYPEDYVIRKDDLVKQWVAEGFLTSVKLQDMEQVAGIYFDELVTRGMIQPLETNYNDEVLSCALHHMVVDLIAQKSTEQNFITVMYYNATVTGHPDKVRRLSLKFGAAESARITGSFRMSQVRSLIFSGFFKCVPSLVEYRLLHVLILHIWTDQDKTSFNLAMIQEMFRLRYLKVECNMTVKLPASIAGLQCLGTMEIHARVAAIPSDIVHLQRLLHLRLPSGTDLPHGIGHMTSLRSLSYFNISTSSRGDILDLGKLTNLHDLHLSCSRVRSKRLHSNMKLLASILGSINLRSLTLDVGASSDESIPSEGLSSLSSGSCPPILLERLKLSPGICIFFHIPKWVGELSKLCVLKIAVKELSSDDVDMLKGLPALSALSLYVQVTTKKIVIDEKGFSVLKNFKFICRAPPCMEFMSGAMPTVRRLKLGFSAYQIVQCRGLEHLKDLSVVYAKVERAGVDDSGRKAIQSKLKDIFKASPVVNVIWVDRVFGNKDTQPGVRTTMSSSESSSCTTNPGTQNEVEDIKIKTQKKNHQCYREQRENAAEDSEEYTIPEKGLGVSARTGLSTESSPCQQDQDRAPLSTRSAPMAELAVSLVVAPLLSLVKDKVCNSLLDQYKVMEGMEKHHEILKLKLPAILDVIADAEKQAFRRGGVKAWLEELKKVAYVGNDVFDEFEYEALRRRAKKDGHITKLGLAGLKLLPTHNRVAFRIRMGNKLSRLVESIKVLVEQMKYFGFDKLQLETAPAWKEWRETDSNIDDDLKSIVIASRDKEREKIIEVLINHQASSSGDLLVIPIVGMGGLGKTTLAQLIYNDHRIQGHFQLLMWVCVSDDFNVRDLANKICDSSKTTLKEALKKLQENLSGKRYLLVLDDVWNKDVDKWGKLKACLKQGGVGSAILTTTRDKEIAGFMGTVANNSWKNRYHNVALLDTEFIQEIIETRAFSLQKTKPEELVKLVGPIAERCVGSPLAAKALGSVLCNKTTKEEWEDILHRSRICNDETGIFPILKLSYNDLPTNMKQCFAFCAMYPKDYPIDVDELIQLWMANGYISDQNRVTAETMGKRIISDMVSRSFFQYEEQRRIMYSSTSVVKIHDLMHDVALSASEEECVCLTGEFFKSGELLPSAARHILFSTSPDKKKINFVFGTTRERFPPIQTMIFGRSYYRDEHGLHSSKFGSLRALSMQGSRIYMSIKPKHLCHLRYLDLSYNEIEALPDDISILYSLQTLKLSHCRRLKRLPEQMKYMTALRHLYTDGCEHLECMPPELGRITSLRTITWFVVGSALNCCSGLEELKDLSIGGSLMLTQLENVTVIRNAKAANLENKKELRQLSLEWTRGREEEQQCREVLESLKAHSGLLALGIYSYQGTIFPSWMGMLKNMVELRLSYCSKAEHLPELLEQLAELQLLHLKGLGKLQFLCSSCTSSTFGKLKDLKLVNLDVFDGFCETIDGDVVAFPRLEILYIMGCKNLAALPEASVLREPYGGGDYKVARSAFPELKELTLVDLDSFERWETAALEIEEEDALLFPSLGTALIRTCPKLTTLPRAPKLKRLDWSYGNGQIFIGGIRYLTSMSSLHLEGVKLDDKDEWHHPRSVVDMELVSCSLFFQPRALALWVCYGQLQDLRVERCDELVYWPEKVFQSLISLRRLWIRSCKNLFGYAAENGPDEAISSGRSQLLPRLESLEIYGCQNLVEVFNSPALKTMAVYSCCKIESLRGKQLLNQEASSTNDVTACTPAEEKQPSASVVPDNLLPSSLEDLTIWHCDGLLEAVNLPSSLRGINIDGCSKLRFVSSSGQLDALQDLRIWRCPELRLLESLCIKDLSALEVLNLYDGRSLASLPSAPEPQEYSSLRWLTIKKCPGIKSLPSALQQRLDSGLMDVADLDSHLKGRRPGLLDRLCSSL